MGCKKNSQTTVKHKMTLPPNLGMAIVPANSQIRPNPPAKPHPLRIILRVAGEFGITN